jgi:hypothetical protein
MKTANSTPPPAFGLVCGLILCLLLPGAVVLAEGDTPSDDKPTKPAEKTEPAKPAAAAPRKVVSPILAAAQKKTGPDDEDVKVYSNDDLPELTQVGTSQPTAKPTSTITTQPEWDPLARLEESQQQGREDKELVAAAQARFEEAEQQVAALEKRQRSITNPYMARPQALEEEGVDWNTMTPTERLAWTNEALEKARIQRAEAQQRLARLGSTR